jgi:hypothetical protein
MAVLDFNNYPSLQSNIFISIDVPGYEVVTFSDYHRPLTIDSVVYDGLGNLLSVSTVNSNLRATGEEITIGISGIPEENISLILNNRVKGSKVVMYRAFFNSITGNLLTVSNNPVGLFRGIISNYEIADDLEGDTGSVSLVMTATNFISLLENKYGGRYTNPIDQNTYFPNDRSMDRVPALSRSNFNFGAPV